MDTFLPQTLFYVSAIPCRNNIVLRVLNSIRIFSWQTLFKITFICIKNHRNKSFSNGLIKILKERFDQSYSMFNALSETARMRKKIK